MPLTNYSLDKFVAQNLSKLTSPATSPVGPEFPTSGNWISSFVLHSILTTPVTVEGARHAFAWLRRANAAIEDYDEACGLIKSAAQERNPSIYFRALGKFEHSIALIYQAHIIASKSLGIKAFEKGDKSALERVNLIYNEGRHSNLDFPGEFLHPVWLENDGMHSFPASLKFAEIETLLRELGSIADKISKAQFE